MIDYIIGLDPSLLLQTHSRHRVTVHLVRDVLSMDHWGQFGWTIALLGAVFTGLAGAHRYGFTWRQRDPFTWMTQEVREERIANCLLVLEGEGGGR